LSDASSTFRVPKISARFGERIADGSIASNANRSASVRVARASAKTWRAENRAWPASICFSTA